MASCLRQPRSGQKNSFPRPRRNVNVGRWVAELGATPQVPTNHAAEPNRLHQLLPVQTRRSPAPRKDELCGSGKPPLSGLLSSPLSQFVPPLPPLVCRLRQRRGLPRRAGGNGPLLSLKKKWKHNFRPVPPPPRRQPC